MNSKKIKLVYFRVLIPLGILLLVASAGWILLHPPRWSFALLLLGSGLLTPFMSISMPRGKLTLEFSDAFVFLAIVIYGASEAVLISATSMLSVCIYLNFIKNSKISLFGTIRNIGINVLSTALTTSFVLGIYYVTNQSFVYASSTDLVPKLGLIALVQFGFTTLLAFPHSPKFGTLSVRDVWLSDFSSLSLAYTMGAVVAFLAIELFYNYSIFTTVTALILIYLGYINYRQTINEVELSIKNLKKAEREKAEIEKVKKQDAEKHAGELAILLDKEEKISEDLRRSIDRFEYSAYHDPLTDLPNRRYLMERLKFLLEMGLEKSNTYYVVYFNLSRFKNINDAMGHSFGDKVLKMVALRLHRTMRDEDTIARLGGDEFALILTNLATIEKAQVVARKIYDTVTKPFVIGGNEIYSDIHLGLAPLQFEHVRPEDVLRDSNIAMQQAKKSGTRISVFDKSIRVDHLEKIRIENDLRVAIERDQMFMHYQPLISLTDGSLVGFEALLRWKHPKLGMISPGVFVPIGEESGTIVPITNWILATTCTQIQEWNKTRGKNKKLMVSVNVSSKHLTDFTLIRDVKRALTISNLPPHLLKIEITESAAMENPERSIRILDSLTMLGVKLSIDDFGTGYSSLSYLHQIPFSMLKIDRSFVQNAEGGSKQDLKILETIVALTRNLKKDIIAEGVETVAQMEMLQKLDCEYAQGFLFSRPLPIHEITRLLENETPWLDLNQTKPSYTIETPPQQDGILVA
ncbi:MAG: putative bifunctional diguanylate cyclase/phosphodiesterase [Pyrinomonadaceae bacterium]